MREHDVDNERSGMKFMAGGRQLKERNNTQINQFTGPTITEVDGGFALSCLANICACVIVNDFCVLSAQICLVKSQNCSMCIDTVSGGVPHS
jgi:hypothetical protein